MENGMNLQEVKTAKDAEAFLKAPLAIYKNDAFWVRPMDNDVNAVFDVKKNKYFRHGEAIRWILTDDSGKCIGRVAAFINQKSAKTFEQPTGGMGFFECINDKKAAFILFDACHKWLQERGMEAMDGPINFGEKDRWWGLMIDGYSEPTYCMNYNLPYYKDLFDAYGFKTYYEQYCYHLPVNCVIPEKYQEKADRIKQNPAYTCEHIRKNELEKYTQDFLTIYNKAWGKHAGFKEMELPQAKAIMRSIKPIMEENLLWFTYYNGEPIGFFIMLPELNKIIRHLNGKMNNWGKLKFLWYRWRGVCDKTFGVIFGIIPEHQGKGVEGFIIMSAAAVIQKENRYKDLEMTWIGDFNPKMIHLVESLGATRCKTYATMRKLFDENKPFARAEIIK
ncbi:MAG: hypothetical protein WCL14_08010 [Bacteroidota bacterium]